MDGSGRIPEEMLLRQPPDAFVFDLSDVGVQPFLQSLGHHKLRSVLVSLDAVGATTGIDFTVAIAALCQT